MRVLLAAALACAACSPPPDAGPTTDEGKLRASLGIPASAEKVIIFSQNAHLDIDWQKTFDGYYDSFVGTDFIEARQILDDQPRAFYSVAEMAFLKHHLEAHPEEVDAIRGHAARGAFHIVGGGITSPDTLLPESELVFRDFLFGARFSEDQLGVRPTAAWLPDSFGHASTVPDLLVAAGFDSVGFSRVDGAPTFFEDAIKHRPIKPGSDAEMLHQMGSDDFMWISPTGAEVLAHWMSAGLYCMGDNIDFDEELTIAGGHLGPYYGDDPTFTDGRIAKYLAELDPYAKTPYRYVNVGCDFQHPKAELISYLDGWNQRQFASTKVWAVAAPFDVYTQLVRFHKDVLPSLPMDITPYFMGFYGTRADLKRRVREAARPFFTVETFATAVPQGKAITDALSPEFERLARADHHDFVTGTANDLVAQSEQLPLMDEVEGAGNAALQQLARAYRGMLHDGSPGANAYAVVFNPTAAARSEVIEIELPQPSSARALTAVASDGPLPTELLPATTGSRRQRVRFALPSIDPLGWREIAIGPGGVAPPKQVQLVLSDGNGAPASGAAVKKVVLSNAHVTATFARGAQGFALASLLLDGKEAIAGPSFTAIDYQDMGGLWRLGNEMPGCSFTALPPGDGSGETVQVLDDGALVARVAFTVGGATREAWLAASDTGLSLAFTTGAGEGITRTARFAFAEDSGAVLRTSLAGGFAERDVEKVYTPTFWPAVEWVTVGDAAILLRQSTGVRFGGDGSVELMAARDVRNEQCDVEGGTGTDPGLHRIEWQLVRAATPADAAKAGQRWNRPLAAVMLDGKPTGAADPDGTIGSLDGSGILTAWKPADRGRGTIVRALLLPGPVTIYSPVLVGAKLHRTDTSERDLEDLGTNAGISITLDVARFGPIATVRIE
jgi:hypothetical protein